LFTRNNWDQFSLDGHCNNGTNSLKHCRLIRPWCNDPFGKFINAHCKWETVEASVQRKIREKAAQNQRRGDPDWYRESKFIPRYSRRLFHPRFVVESDEARLKRRRQETALQLEAIVTKHPHKKDRIAAFANIIGVKANIDWEKEAIYRERYQYIRYGSKVGEGSFMLQRWLDRLSKLTVDAQQAHTAAFLGDRDRFLDSLA
jgi:hypothetical protein